MATARTARALAGRDKEVPRCQEGRHGPAARVLKNLFVPRLGDADARKGLQANVADPVNIRLELVLMGEGMMWKRRRAQRQHRQLLQEVCVWEQCHHK